MKLYNRRTKRLICLWVEIFIVTIAGWFVWEPLGNVLIEISPNLFPLLMLDHAVAVCRRVGLGCYILAGVQIFALVVWWCCRHKLHKGIVYAVKHAWYCGRITRALVQAGAGYGLNEQDRYITPPRVLLFFDKGMAQGSIKIRSHIKYDRALETLNLSPVIGRYRIMQAYITDDGNYWVYEFEDSRLDHRLIFNSYEKFVFACQQAGDYKITANGKYTLPLASMLLSGTTGSGKTYAAYSIIMQMLNWTIRPTIYFCDPKNSSLYVMGRKIAPEHTAGTVEGIIELLKQFYEVMQQRKLELQPKLEMRLDSTYKDWSMPAYVFVLDETSAFMSAVTTMDKASRDKVSKILRSITLEGRQIGCILMLLTQKADSTDIPTQIRDNLVFKCVLGNAPNTTYLTTFEKAADLPKRKFFPGEGLFSYQGITREPQPISFPTLNFDILRAVTEHLSPDCKI